MSLQRPLSWNSALRGLNADRMMAAYDRLRTVRPTTAAGFRALAEA